MAGRSTPNSLFPGGKPAGAVVTEVEPDEVTAASWDDDEVFPEAELSDEGEDDQPEPETPDADEAEVVEEQEELELAPEEEEPEAEAPPEGISDKANKRFREMARRVREAEKKAADAEAASYRQQMLETSQIQRQALEMAMKDQQARQEAIKAQEYEAYLVSKGYDPGDASHVVARAAHEQTLKIQAELDVLRKSAAEERQARSTEIAQRDFRSKLEKSFDAQFQGRKIDPSDREDLIANAWARAYAQQEDPEAAMRAVLKPVLKHVPKASAQPKPPAEQQKLLRKLSGTTTAADRKASQKFDPGKSPEEQAFGIKSGW